MNDLAMRALAAIIIFSLGIGSGYNLKAKEAALELSRQIVKAKEKEVDQDANTYNVAVAYSDIISALDKRLRDKPRLPTTAVNSSSANAEVREYGNTCTRAFYEAGLRDAAKIAAFQGWVMVQKIPVRD